MYLKLRVTGAKKTQYSAEADVIEAALLGGAGRFLTCSVPSPLGQQAGWMPIWSWFTERGSPPLRSLALTSFPLFQMADCGGLPQISQVSPSCHHPRGGVCVSETCYCLSSSCLLVPTSHDF